LGLSPWQSRRIRRRIAVVALTVLIVDDHAEFRAAARRLLESGGLEVIGEAGSIGSAMAAIRERSPDVVLLDVQLPDGDGIEAAADLSDDCGGRAVVLVSSRDETAYGERLAASAARGFIRKTDLSAGRVMALLNERR
jgi:DNA-binding NarL/FixJ family response regulator